MRIKIGKTKETLAKMIDISAKVIDAESLFSWIIPPLRLTLKGI